MTTERFNEIVNDLTTQIKNTVIRKAGEYNLDDDRLSVFKRAAGIQQQTQAQALLGMMTKHVVSIYDYVEGNKQFTEALAREKIVDNLNYLILLYAVLIILHTFFCPAKLFHVFSVISFYCFRVML